MFQNHHGMRLGGCSPAPLSPSLRRPTRRREQSQSREGQSAWRVEDVAWSSIDDSKTRPHRCRNLKTRSPPSRTSARHFLHHRFPFRISSLIKAFMVEYFSILSETCAPSLAIHLFILFLSSTGNGKSAGVSHVGFSGLILGSPKVYCGKCLHTDFTASPPIADSFAARKTSNTSGVPALEVLPNNSKTLFT